MTKKTLKIASNLQNDLESSNFFAHKKVQNSDKIMRTPERVNSSSQEQANKRTGEQGTDLISEKTVRKPFNIFEEHDIQIDWYIAEKKRAGKKSYNRSMFMRELLDKFFAREKKLGRMKNFNEKANG